MSAEQRIVKVPRITVLRGHGELEVRDRDGGRGRARAPRGFLLAPGEQADLRHAVGRQVTDADAKVAVHGRRA